MEETLKKRRSNQLLNSRNTKPEMKVQKVLEKKNIYFLKHIKTLAGTPDIIIPSLNIIIDIKGCFWHQHGCIHSKLPKSNQIFWFNKFEKIKIKDVLNLRLNQRKGWKTFEIWECIINDKKRLKEEIEKILAISEIYSKIDASNRDIINNLI